jgi:hypothetical protein
VDVIWTVVGWIGSGCIILGYALVATRRLSSHSVAFHVVTLLGSVGLTVYALAIAAWPNVALNGFMGAVAMVGVYMALRVVRQMKLGTEPSP